MPLATTLRSLIEHNRSSRTPEILVLSDGFTDTLKRKVADSLPKTAASLRWIEVNLDTFCHFATRDGVSKTTYARLLVAQFLSPTATRAVYLDADVLVLDDITTLWTTDLEGAILGAVFDRLDAQVKSQALKLPGLPNVRNYFNAGLLLIDLERWRHERVPERALEYLTANPKSPHADQDALNFACDGKWKQLDSRWNFQDHCDLNLALLPRERRPAIVHFVTNDKPWKPSSLSVNATFYDLFRSRTRFARTPAERAHDIACSFWHRAKRLLRRSPLLRRAWNRFSVLRTSSSLPHASRG